MVKRKIVTKKERDEAINLSRDIKNCEQKIEKDLIELKTLAIKIAKRIGLAPSSIGNTPKDYYYFITSLYK